MEFSLIPNLWKLFEVWTLWILVFNPGYVSGYSILLLFLLYFFYHSLNRKCEQTTADNYFTLLKAAKFCHECGFKYPILDVKFCTECGMRRIVSWLSYLELRHIQTSFTGYAILKIDSSPLRKKKHNDKITIYYYFKLYAFFDSIL